MVLHPGILSISQNGIPFREKLTISPNCIEIAPIKVNLPFYDSTFGLAGLLLFQKKKQYLKQSYVVECVSVIGGKLFLTQAICQQLLAQWLASA